MSWLYLVLAGLLETAGRFAGAKSKGRGHVGQGASRAFGDGATGRLPYGWPTWGGTAPYRQQMSLDRQIGDAPNPPPAPTTGGGEPWATAAGKERHSHQHHQLLYSSKGLAHVNTAEGSWILPPTRAIWISGSTD